MWSLFLVAPVLVRNLPELLRTEARGNSHLQQTTPDSPPELPAGSIFTISGADAADTQLKLVKGHEWPASDLDTCGHCQGRLSDDVHQVGLDVFPGEVALLSIQLDFVPPTERTDEGRRNREADCNEIVASVLAWLQCYSNSHALGSSYDKDPTTPLWVSRTLVRLGPEPGGRRIPDDHEVLRWWLDVQETHMLPYDGYDNASYFFQYGNNAIDLPAGWCSDWATMRRVLHKMQLFSAEQALLRRELAELYDKLQAISLSDELATRDRDIEMGLQSSERLMGRGERLRLWYDDYLLNMQADRAFASHLESSYLVDTAFEAQERSTRNILRVLGTVRLQSQYGVDRRRRRWENVMNALLATIGAIAIFDILLNLVWFTSSEDDIRLLPPYGILFLVTRAQPEFVVLAGALLVVLVGGLAYLLGKWITRK